MICRRISKTVVIISIFKLMASEKYRPKSTIVDISILLNRKKTMIQKKKNISVRWQIKKSGFIRGYRDSVIKSKTLKRQFAV